jgi:hypothetical protein
MKTEGFHAMFPFESMCIRLVERTSIRKPYRVTTHLIPVLNISHATA